ncbi:MAG: Hsp20/alpha crystallin family protein [Nanoarchaeota archaeon]|mgnify:CR=1 FL=1
MWDPFDEIKRIHREMDNMFRRFFESRNKIFKLDKELENFREPLADIKKTDKEYIIEIELPGVNKEDVILQVSNDLIEIRAKKQSELKIEKKGYLRHERSYSGFYRTIPLPFGVKEDEVESEFKNGILKIKVPKSKEKIKKKVMKVIIK